MDNSIVWLFASLMLITILRILKAVLKWLLQLIGLILIIAALVWSLHFLKQKGYLGHSQVVPASIMSSNVYQINQLTALKFPLTSLL